MALLRIDLDRWTWLEDGVFEEIRRRQLGAEAEGAGPRETVLPIAPEQTALAEMVFDLGFRAAAKRAHPDAGGHVLGMQQLNPLRESVQSQFRQIAGGGL